MSYVEGGSSRSSVDGGQAGLEARGAKNLSHPDDPFLVGVQERYGAIVIDIPAGAPEDWIPQTDSGARSTSSQRTSSI